MKTNDAFCLLAKRIFKTGESKHKGNFCLVPTAYAKDNTNPSDYNKVSDFFYAKHKATHFDIHKENDCVKITLYKSDFFGACKEESLKEVVSKVISITEII